MSADPADSADSTRATRNPWPRRIARATAILTFPLLLLGGLVTTLRVGMAVPDWPTTFGHNMFTYPLPQMLANGGVLWEHSHRLFGSLVGMAAIALVFVHWRFEKRTSLRVLSVAVLLAVIVQGIIGGVRVLQVSDELAFVHGSLAQAVFALIGAVAVMQSDAWVAARSQQSARAVKLRRVALVAIVVVYAQIVVGAWLRHTGNMNALGIHIVLAAAAVGAVVALGRELERVADELAERDPARAAERGPLVALRSPLVALRRHLRIVLWTQIVLGLLAAVWVFVVTGPHNPVSIGEAIFATLHVGVGALLLLLCVSAALWSKKLASSGAVAHGARDAGASGPAHAGGAR
jgi:cytochrome c oxidase assembly protein subunit 15